MKMQVIIDTSVLVGLVDSQDIWHNQAVELIAGLQTLGYLGIYFDCVIAETVSVATRRLREKKRFAEIEVIINHIISTFPSDSLTWISYEIPFLYNDILSLICTSGGELNFNDALIALASQNRKIPFIASFDRDFDQIPGLQRFSDASEVIHF